MALPALAEAQKSSSSAIWKWILGGVITIVAALVLWKMRRQAAKITQLENEKSELQAKLDESLINLKQAKNNTDTATLVSDLGALHKQIQERDATLIGAKAWVEQAREDLRKVTTW
jgi:hypothetical protein